MVLFHTKIFENLSSEFDFEVDENIFFYPIPGSKHYVAKVSEVQDDYLTLKLGVNQYNVKKNDPRIWKPKHDEIVTYVDTYDSSLQSDVEYVSTDSCFIFVNRHNNQITVATKTRCYHFSFEQATSFSYGPRVLQFDDLIVDAQDPKAIFDTLTSIISPV